MYLANVVFIFAYILCFMGLIKNVELHTKYKTIIEPNSCLGKIELKITQPSWRWNWGLAWQKETVVIEFQFNLSVWSQIGENKYFPFNTKIRRGKNIIL